MAISKEREKEIIHQYYNVIYKYCCSRCRNKTDAEDVTQNVFFILAKNLSNIDDTCIKAWLYKVAGNEIKKFFKKTGIESGYISIQDCAGLEYEYGLDDDGCDHEIIFSEAQERIMSILNDEEKELFIRFFIEEIKPKEFAEQTGITENNANVKKYRLRNKIIKFLNNDGFVLLVIGFKLFSLYTKR